MRAKKAAVQHKHPSHNVRVIGVVGQYGKTTTARLLAEILRESGLRVAVFTNRGSWIENEPYTLAYDGSADAVQRAIATGRKKADIVIIEITPALCHTHVLPTLQLEMSIVTSEGSLMPVVLEQPATYVVVPSAMNPDDLQAAPHQRISFGEDSLAEAQISHVRLMRKGTEVDITLDHHTKHLLSSYLLGGANVRNVAAAVAAAYVLGVAVDVLPEGVARVEELPGNMQYLASEAPYVCMVDAAHTKEACEYVLEAVRQFAKRRVLVAADNSLDSEAAKYVAEKCDQLTLVDGEEKGNVYTAKDIHAAAAHTLRGAKKDDFVLFLGTHYAALDDTGAVVAQSVLDQAHE